MRYISTRGEAPTLDFADVLLTGLARDGGLYLPETWPQLDLAALKGKTYAEVAAAVMLPFVAGSIPEADFRKLVDEAYATFAHREVAPLRQLGPCDWLMELFHGPTLAFKDVALQLLGRLFDYELGRRGSRTLIVGATSGDTGSAAIEACRGSAAIDIFILHPKGRVSEVQRRQMTTVLDGNVHNIAIEGTFDDAQAMVKALFNDHGFRDRYSLSAINSINWARVMAQIVYYVTAALALGAPGRKVSFSVPTGNFGDVFAGYAAKKMGVPIERLIVATNRNDILTRFLDTGEYRMDDVTPTMSPSMDIQVASNFERLLYDVFERDGARVRAALDSLSQSRGFAVTPAELARARADFDGARVDEAETLATMARVRKEAGFLIDPHGAVGGAAAYRRRVDPDVPMVTLGTAHPAKFGAAVAQATGEEPALPPRMADLLAREERYTVLPNDLAVVRAHIAARVGG